MPPPGPPDGGSRPDEGRNGTAAHQAGCRPAPHHFRESLALTGCHGQSRGVSEPDPAVLDLDQIRAAFGDIDDDVRDLLRLFVETTRPTLEDLDRGIAARDQDGAENAVHSAKGAARSAGAMTMAAICERLEMAVKAGDWGAVERDRVALRPAFAAAEAAIRAL
jgi:HPt (histidine-containing phosphotransfer) domain-containing protein